MRLIFCEGYSDRSFLKGFLESRGCQSASVKVKNNSPGTFEFTSPTNKTVRVVPVKGGLGRIPQILRAMAKDPQIEPEQMAVIRDLDLKDERSTSLGQQENLRHLCNELREEPYKWAQCPIPQVVYWGTGSTSDLSPKCLEQFIFESLSDIAPDDAIAIRDFLKRAISANKSDIWPEPTLSSQVKSHLLTMMSAFHPDAGCDYFYQWVWQQPRCAQSLQHGLGDSWKILCELAQ